MKLSKQKLRQIVEEELSNYLSNIYKWCPEGSKCAPEKKKKKWWKRKMRTLDEILDEMKENPKPLDQALDSLSPKERKEYEEAIELWITYGGD